MWTVFLIVIVIIALVAFIQGYFDLDTEDLFPVVLIIVFSPIIIPIVVISLCCNFFYDTMKKLGKNFAKR